MLWEMESLSSQQLIACIGVKQSLENNNNVCNTALKCNNSRRKSADTSKIDYTIWERNNRRSTQVHTTKVSGKASSGGESREDQGKHSREDQGKLSREDQGKHSREDPGKLSREDQGKHSREDPGKLSREDQGKHSREDPGKLSREEQGILSREDPGRGSRIIKSALASTNNDEFLVFSGTQSNVASRNTTSCCHVPSVRKEAARQAATKILKTQLLENNKKIQILELKINAAKKSLEEFRHRELHLQAENLDLMKTVDSDEKQAHQEIKELLRKYERFRGGMTNLNSKFQADLANAKCELEQTRTVIDLQLTSMQSKLSELEVELKTRQSELNVLRSYKDVDYPVRCLQIVNLQKQIDSIKLEQQETDAMIQREVGMEFEKLEKTQALELNCVKESAALKAVNKVHPTVQSMANENKALQKEVQLHLEEIETVEESNRMLRNEVEDLLTDPKTSVRQTVFPEFYSFQKKCTPDMDIILDIPVHQFLPI